ncbi:class I SAM-dependent methyltransferase [Streptomyces sp. AJS327]|nr:class I SAM-dependent methyltransferase [Streptomyces sp. AJS327]
MTYYSTAAEALRLTASADGRLELLRTQELLRARLPRPPALVLDVGGGPGTHARWLVGDGYQVRLVDPVPLHVEQARALPGCAAELGDARELHAMDGSFDAVLLLGPLYHLVERADRDRALAEAHRVLRPGGLLAAAGINRYAALFDHTALAHLHRDSVREEVSAALGGPARDESATVTTVHFHGATELGTEVTNAGFTGTEVRGVEGPAWSLLKAAEQVAGRPLDDSALFESALTAARLADPYPELLAASSHLLALANKPA